jgi:hypothetical protein
VSNNPFERRIAEWLRSDPNIWAHHPPDYAGERKLWAPADFLVLVKGVLTALECKNQQSGSTFPLSGWTPQQRQSLRDITRAGGHYILLVNYAEHNRVVAFRPDPDIGRGSLGVTGGRVVTKQTIHTILDGSL